MFGLLVLCVLTPLAERAENGALPPHVPGFQRFYEHSPAEPLGGALLLTELGCTACHRHPADLLAPKRAPLLTNLAGRVQPDWLEKFLLNPSQTVPGTTMPDVLPQDAATRQSEARALAAFLRSRPVADDAFSLHLPKTVIVAPQFWQQGDPDRGRDLFHRVGCVACHQPDADFPSDDQSAIPEMERLLRDQGLEDEEIAELLAGKMPGPVQGRPLDFVSKKYTRRGLTFFLFDPLRVRPDGRMPQMRLTAEESADAAAYLLENGGDNDSSNAIPAVDAALITQGKKLFAERGCQHCHEPQDSAAEFAKPLTQLPTQTANGCLHATSPGPARYALTDAQRTALAAVLSNSDLPVDHISGSAAARVQHTFLQLNCYACHVRETQGGVGRNRWQYFATEGHVDLGDEGRIPPNLTSVGRKLTRGGIEKVLSGEGDVRPHLLARMPVFAAEEVKHLPADLLEVDDDQAAAVALGGDLEAGRQLLNVGCIQCHPLHDERLPGVMGVDLATSPQRLQFEWFRSFLLQPATEKPGTRMPSFFPNGNSNSPEILDGDVQRQIASLWQYLSTEPAPPLPDRLQQERLHNFELQPKDRPIVLRSFAHGAGTHAVVVGFPQQVSLIFDAQALRPGVFWRGRFVDVRGAWFDRFAPPLEPLDQPQITFPALPPMAELSTPSADWPRAADVDLQRNMLWRGYRLDAQRVPTLLYRIGPWHVEDRFAADSDSADLRRTLQLQWVDADVSASASWWMLLHSGNELRPAGDHAMVDEQKLRVQLQATSAETKVQRGRDVTLWLLRLPNAEQQKPLKIQVDYSW